MFWIVQENVAREAKFDELIAQLERFEIPHQIVKVVPFAGELIPAPDLPADARVWCVGSMSMLNTCKASGWLPGVITLDHFNIARQLMEPWWREEMLNHDAKYCIMDDIAKDRVPLYQKNFVRPVDDSKFITGQIMTDTELREWVKKALDCKEVDWKTELIVAKPKDIVREARFWVVAGRIVTASQYRHGGHIWYSQSEIPSAMHWYATWVVNTVKQKQLNIETYCLDIAEVPWVNTPQYRIIEINNMNSCGLYDSDPQKMIMAIEEAYG